VPAESGCPARWASVSLAVFALLASHCSVANLEGQDQPTERTTGLGIDAQRQTLPPSRLSPHRFWDSTNAALFSGVTAARTLDFHSTQHFRNKGVNERLLTNAVVDNKPLFAAIEVGGVAASLGFSYLFHRTGHHKLERWVSIVHISIGTGGALRNYTLEPDQAYALPPGASRR
jgi:hypothetical protein